MRSQREPSGSRFNSIVQLEYERGIPRNPFINAGAIAVTDLILAGHRPREALGEILRFVRFVADDDSIGIDEAVAASEQRTGYRNVALFGVVNLVAVIVIARLTISGFASVWCGWAAVSSAAITLHCRFAKPRPQRARSGPGGLISAG